MIRYTLACIAVWMVASATTLAATLVGNLSDVSYWVGTGQNQAVLIIDWQDGKNAPGESAGQALAWGYRWPVGQTRTGLQMLLDVVAADPELHSSMMFSGQFVFGLAYDLDGDGGLFTFDQVNEMGFPSDPDDHFAEGLAENGFWAYTTGQSTGVRPAFSEAMDGAFNRALTNGSWDAWVFTADLTYPYAIPQPSPALAVAPEPSTAMLLGMGGLAFVYRRRRSR